LLTAGLLVADADYSHTSEETGGDINVVWS